MAEYAAGSDPRGWWRRTSEWLRHNPISGFFLRNPLEHIRLATAASRRLFQQGLWDSSGIAFLKGAYHRFRSFGYPHGSERFTYHKTRAAGKYLGVSSFAFRPGYLAGGLTLATNLQLAVQNPFGPFYGYAVNTVSFTAALPAIRLGWGLGAAAGRASGALWYGLGRGVTLAGTSLGRAGAAMASGGSTMWRLGSAMRASRYSGWQTTGRILRGASAASTTSGTALRGAGRGLAWLGRGLAHRLVISGLVVGSTMAGGILGAAASLLAPLAIEYAATELPKLGHRLSRRGFGNLYGPYQDTRAAITMRQQAIAAISQSQLNARNALGGEAALIHLT